MRIGILTSSRADYGIYRPLLKALKADDLFQAEIIAFGTHLSPYHGYTLRQIQEDGFEVKHTVQSLTAGDDENAIATAFSITSLKFADLWKQYADNYDLVFCLGDRFEMFAAVAAGIPYTIPFAHIHGGETTTGAIDNIYRHAITLASRLHFVSAEAYKRRVAELLGQETGIYTVGSLSLDTLADFKPLSITEFREKWGIDLSVPSILMTIHPETVNASRNDAHLREIEVVLSQLAEGYQLVITMPNADTMGSLYRAAFRRAADQFPEKVKLVENFGTESYFSCMQHSRFLLGNTSSGIIEAASFGKYVINIGDRQKGRLAGENVLHTPITRHGILDKVRYLEERGAHEGGCSYTGTNIFWNGGAAATILNVLKTIYQ